MTPAPPRAPALSAVRTVTLVAVGALLAAPALAQTALDRLDADADGAVSAAELRAAFEEADAVARLDADGDALLAPDELAEALRVTWDTDDDGVLSVDEWDAGVDRWFGEADVDLAVEAWDRDGDGLVSQAELTAALEETDLFAGLDADGDARLGDDELADAALDAADADADADGVVAAEEDDGFLADLAEAFLDPAEEDGPVEGEAGPPEQEIEVDVADPVADEDGPLEGEAPLIERGEPFVQLPVPCEGSCEETAARFCEALGYEPPLGTLAVENQLHVIRCADEI